MNYVRNDRFKNTPKKPSDNLKLRNNNHELEKDNSSSGKENNQDPEIQITTHDFSYEGEEDCNDFVLGSVSGNKTKTKGIVQKLIDADKKKKRSKIRFKDTSSVSDIKSNQALIPYGSVASSALLPPSEPVRYQQPKKQSAAEVNMLLTRAPKKNNNNDVYDANGAEIIPRDQFEVYMHQQEGDDEQERLDNYRNQSRIDEVMDQYNNRWNNYNTFGYSNVQIQELEEEDDNDDVMDENNDDDEDYKILSIGEHDILTYLETFSSAKMSLSQYTDIAEHYGIPREQAMKQQIYQRMDFRNELVPDSLMKLHEKHQAELRQKRVHQPQVQAHQRRASQSSTIATTAGILRNSDQKSSRETNERVTFEEGIAPGAPTNTEVTHVDLTQTPGGQAGGYVTVRNNALVPYQTPDSNAKEAPGAIVVPNKQETGQADLSALTGINNSSSDESNNNNNNNMKTVVKEASTGSPPSPQEIEQQEKRWQKYRFDQEYGSPVLRPSINIDTHNAGSSNDDNNLLSPIARDSPSEHESQDGADFTNLDPKDYRRFDHIHYTPWATVISDTPTPLRKEEVAMSLVFASLDAGKEPVRINTFCNVDNLKMYDNMITYGFQVDEHHSFVKLPQYSNKNDPRNLPESLHVDNWNLERWKGKPITYKFIAKALRSLAEMYDKEDLRLQTVDVDELRKDMGNVYNVGEKLYTEFLDASSVDLNKLIAEGIIRKRDFKELVARNQERQRLELEKALREKEKAEAEAAAAELKAREEAELQARLEAEEKARLKAEEEARLAAEEKARLERRQQELAEEEKRQEAEEAERLKQAAAAKAEEEQFRLAEQELARLRAAASSQEENKGRSTSTTSATPVTSNKSQGGDEDSSQVADEDLEDIELGGIPNSKCENKFNQVPEDKTSNRVNSPSLQGKQELLTVAQLGQMGDGKNLKLLAAIAGGLTDSPDSKEGGIGDVDPPAKIDGSKVPTVLKPVPQKISPKEGGPSGAPTGPSAQKGGGRRRNRGGKKKKKNKKNPPSTPGSQGSIVSGISGVGTAVCNMFGGSNDSSPSSTTTYGSGGSANASRNSFDALADNDDSVDETMDQADEDQTPAQGNGSQDFQQA